MGKIGLQIKATLENVTDLEPVGEDYQWFFKFKCTSCGEETSNFISMSEDSKSEIPGSRGEAHLVFKCKLCSRSNSVDILPGTKSKYTIDNSEQFKTIVVLDCRGVEPIDFNFSSGFKCSAINSSSKFEDIDLKDKEWVEYDDKAKETVGIYDLTHSFVKV